MRYLALSLLALALGSCSRIPLQPEAVPAAERDWDKLTLLTKLDDKEIDESSGVAPSHLRPGIFYTHNDSGDKPRFFSFDDKGHVTGSYSVPNAEATDWEDMASASIGGKSYLYFGDIGDNNEKRKSITVYRVPEPSPGAVPTAPDQVLVLNYPDGPHNAETLMVHPTAGDIYIVTKTSKGPSLVFKLPNPANSGRFDLAKIGEIQTGGPIDATKLTTGGDISPDGKHVVVRGYLGAWEFDAPARFDDWVKSKPRAIQTNVEPQGEAICYSTDGKSLITTSEGQPCQVSIGKLKG